MTKPSTRAEVNNFIKGFITEASPLNYPANASLDEENFELNRDGSRDRRLGMGYEPSFTRNLSAITPAEADTAKFSTFRWLSVAGSLDNDFLVVQIEQTLKFFDINVDSLSSEGFIAEITLSSFPANTLYSFTSLEGALVVASGVDTVAVVTYDGTNFSVVYERLLVRDSWGIEVTGVTSYETDAAYRGAYDVAHAYNLQNQSWGIPRKNSAGTLVDPTTQYFNDLGKYPSNSETVWTGLQFQPVTGGTTFERIYTNLYEEILGATVVATKGYFVIDALRRGASRIQQFLDNHTKYPTLSTPVITAPSDVTLGGAKVVTEFAGRVWYSGFSGEVIDGDKRSPDFSNFVFFSQLVRNRSDFNKCYQEGDPSSRDSTDLVDTDGGFIRVAGAKGIISLVNLESSLIVIATNGVWQISGGADYGFTATNYKITKISAFGGLSQSSVVIEGGRAFFWSEDGIYVIAKDNLGNLGVVNITQTTIQTFYESIPSASKEEASGVYDAIGKKIRWLFKTGTRFGVDSVTKELVLDTSINAFYKNNISTLSNNTVQIVDLFISAPFKRGITLTNVYSGPELVLSDVDTVVSGEVIRSTGIQSTRYLAVEIKNGNVYTTFSYYNDSDFLDWKDVDTVGEDAQAFLLAGQNTAGDSAIAKQMPYLIMYFTRTESGVDANLNPLNQSGCFMRCQWDFSNTIVSNKWSALVQTYRYRRALTVTSVDDPYDNGFSVIATKSKVRGRGKAFSLYLETEPLKDCRILGWNISLNGNSNV